MFDVPPREPSRVATPALGGEVHSGRDPSIEVLRGVVDQAVETVERRGELRPRTWIVGFPRIVENFIHDGPSRRRPRTRRALRILRRARLLDLCQG